MIKQLADAIRKFINKLLAPVAVAGITLTSALVPLRSARAQVPTYSPVQLGVPATLAAATTTNFASPIFIDASHQDKVAFQFRTIWGTAGESTGNTNLQFTLAPTVDGLTWDTNKSVILASYNRAATAIFTNIETTNLSASGIMGWYITKEVNNSAAGAATNTLKYGLKMSAP
jgi:hypothetical protein